MFDNLRKLLCNPPVLKLPDFAKPFVVKTDACKDATSTVLFKYYDNGLQPIMYHSCNYAPAERNYGGGGGVRKNCWRFFRHVGNGDVTLIVYKPQ